MEEVKGSNPLCSTIIDMNKLKLTNETPREIFDYALDIGKAAVIKGAKGTIDFVKTLGEEPVLTELDPLGSASWPTGQLTTSERTLLASAMRKRLAQKNAP